MASGSQNMTTYLAKQVIGSNAAANPTGALLQSGANRADDSATGDTWIFLNTVNSATNPWGIFHSQLDNKIKIIGDGTDDFWVDMDTGDTYILGNVGIGYNPETSGNTYKLYVNGTSYLNNTYIVGNVGIGYDPETSGNTYKLYVNGATRIDSTLHIFPNSENYTEGIRIHPYSSWSDITLCGNDNTGDSGTSANSWLLGNNNGNFYITRYGSTSSAADAQRSEFSSVNNQWRLRSYVQAHKAEVYRSGLHIYGPTYGNTATDMVSGTSGLFSWNDGGPQITFDTNATPGGSQAGALIFTDNDNAGTGASWHFVSNQTDWTVTSKRFHARTSITIRDAAAPTATTNSTNTTFIGAAYMELMGGTPYIDFHYNNDTSDYTHRLIANHTDGITLTSKSGVNCWLYVGNGTDTAGIYWPTLGGGVYMNDSKWLRTYNYKPFIIDINENNTWGIGGHRLALGLSGASHVSLMLKGGDVMYGFAVNNDGNWYFGKRTTKSFESRTGDAYAYYGNATLFAPYTNNSVDLGDDTHRWKTIQSYGNITATQGNIWAGTNADTTAERNIGVRSGAGIMYMYSAAATGGNRGIYLSAHGSGSAKNVFLVDTNNNVTFYGTFSGNASSATYLKDRTNSTASYLNYGASGLAASAITWLTCWNGYELRAISKAEMANAVDSSHKWTRIGGDTMSGSLIITGTGDKYFEVKCTDTSCRVELDNSGGNHGLWSSGYWNGSSYTGSAVWFMYRGKDSYAHCGTRLYNAVWNDFAEYRQGETIEGGRAVYDDGTGIMKITTKRLQPAARIISDTFGMAVGESDKAKTPIGVSGRVLAYPYKNRTKYNVGDAVCAAPNGTVDIMTREEIMMYPDRIIGIVSEIPTYDIWRNTLKNEEFGSAEVIVNDRIWVYVK